MAVPSVWVVLFSGAGCTGQLPVGQGISGADARTGALRFGGASWAALRGSKVVSRRAFVKTQTLDSRGRVLEQAAFSELQLNAPVQADKLRQMMSDTEGYRVVKSERVQTTAEAEGWRLKAPVPGFQSRNCYRRPLSKSTSVVQWIFTDGLATVSLFMEPFDPQRHDREGASAMGATHALVRRWPDGAGPWWVSAVGEVPAATLQAFVQGLERRP